MVFAIRTLPVDRIIIIVITIILLGSMFINTIKSFVGMIKGQIVWHKIRKKELVGVRLSNDFYNKKTRVFTLCVNIIMTILGIVWLRDARGYWIFICSIPIFMFISMLIADVLNILYGKYSYLTSEGLILADGKVDANKYKFKLEKTIENEADESIYLIAYNKKISFRFRVSEDVDVVSQIVNNIRKTF